MTDSNNSQKPASVDGNRHELNAKTPWLILTLPLVVVGAILVFSPNFQSIEGARTAPLGGDFLQEWIGAKVFEMNEEQNLYDLGYTRALQHDSDLVGFDWPQEDYFPMVYPPFYYAALEPFAKLPYSTASKIWAVLSAVAFSIFGFLLHRFYPPCRRVFNICFPVALIFVPLLTCFNMGQKSTFLLLILTATFLLLHHRRPFSAGIVFGLIVFKPHLGIVIGLTMLLKGNWRFALGALSVVGFALIFCWLSNSQLLLDYIRVVSKMGDYVQTGGYQLADSHSLWGAAQLTFPGLSDGAVKLVAAVLSVAVVAILIWIMRGKIEIDSTRFSQQFAAMVIATVMLSPHFYSYDLTVLLLPLILVVSAFSPGNWRDDTIELSLGIVLLAIFVMGGLFVQIAGTFKFQPSIFLMTAVMFLIGLRCQSQSKGSRAREN